MALIDQIQIDNKYFQLDLHRDSEINSLIYLAHWQENDLYSKDKSNYFRLVDFLGTSDMNNGNRIQIRGTLGVYQHPQSYLIEITTRDSLIIKGFKYYYDSHSSSACFVLARSKSNPQLYVLFLKKTPQTHMHL